MDSSTQGIVVVFEKRKPVAGIMIEARPVAVKKTCPLCKAKAISHESQIIDMVVTYGYVSQENQNSLKEKILDMLPKELCCVCFENRKPKKRHFNLDSVETPEAPVLHS